MAQFTVMNICAFPILPTHNGACQFVALHLPAGRVIRNTFNLNIKLKALPQTLSMIWLPATPLETPLICLSEKMRLA